MFDFRRITPCCLEKPLSKHKMTIFSKNFGGHDPFGPPLATPMIVIIYNLHSTLCADFQLRVLLLSKHCHGPQRNHKLWLYFT